MATTPTPARAELSAFELLITCNPPILESLLAQVPTETIFRLYQTSSFLRDFFTKSPTSWRYISWRLPQPTVTGSTAIVGHVLGRQSSNYALDQILLNIINPFSTRLTCLELDNTAVSGATLTSTVLILRRDTLLHVSVRGCKNVSLKYHINPWLQMHALARESPSASGPPGFDTLALKSLYTYRCRHHRRRPYLPSSLLRKESDSEPTHELVNTCHKLGIWTDTAWCTTPASRCFRRRGYVKLRVPPDPREVWVVYDRLWRSRNWLGPVEPTRTSDDHASRNRERDCRSWEFDEEGVHGEAIGAGPDVKTTPAHLRQSHRQFVENITCDNCSEQILERCEQCSVMMHCAGCRKTLCASCAFNFPYLRNKNAPEEERNKFWWAPGCAVSPCSMQDHEPPVNPNHVLNIVPVLKFTWCCTEPVFSGGGGITFGNSASRDTDRIRAAPLPSGQGWEDPEFSPDRHDLPLTQFQQADPLSQTQILTGPGGRWSSIDHLFQAAAALNAGEHPSTPIPRVLCDECYSLDHWKVKCKGCMSVLCLKHDIGDRVKARICGYKDLILEKQEYKARQKASKWAALVRARKEKSRVGAKFDAESLPDGDILAFSRDPSRSAGEGQPPTMFSIFTEPGNHEDPGLAAPETSADASRSSGSLRPVLADIDIPLRPFSPASNSTGPLSRSSSPTPSSRSIPPTPESNTRALPLRQPAIPYMPKWRGCQSIFCPATRAPGDHRRRCVTNMRQCVECKTNVCFDCESALEPPCPCRGCRAPLSEANPGNPPSNSDQPDTRLFFCPNCRWGRMVSGICKRKSDAFLTAQQSLKKAKKGKEKLRKPVEERLGLLRSRASETLSVTEEAIDGLVEFFNRVHSQLPGNQHQPDLTVSSSRPSSSEAANDNSNDIQELEDMGALARDLIRRIQRLRDQFRPGSLAALALPDIRVEEVEGNATRATILTAPTHLPSEQGPAAAGSNEQGQPVLTQEDWNDEDDFVDDENHDGPEESSTD